MRKAFKYKLYPSRQQEAAMITMLETHRHLYNRALAEVPKTLKDRVHRCVRCGYEADRDLNAALNIKRLGSSRQARTLSLDEVV